MCHGMCCVFVCCMHVAVCMLTCVVVFGSLRDNGIGAEGAIALAEALRVNTGLKTLRYVAVCGCGCLLCGWRGCVMCVICDVVLLCVHRLPMCVICDVCLQFTCIVCALCVC